MTRAHLLPPFQRPAAPRLATLVLPLVAALGACAMTPLPVAAQLGPPLRAVVEGYLAHGRLEAGVADGPARVEALGARVLLPVSQFATVAPGSTLDRLDVGAFVAGAPADEQGVAARHYGMQADLRLAPRPLAGRVTPIASLGVGALHARRELAPRTPFGAACLAPAGAADASPPARCLALAPHPRTTRSAFALSPALGARVALVPGLALRLDARDVLLFRDARRHNPELAVGLSFLR